MRTLLRHLPLLLTLLIPLGLLAWLGSRELTRLEQRARSILQEEAHRFLKTEEKKVRTEIDALAKNWLWNVDASGIDLVERLAGDRTLIQVSQELGETSSILDVFITDERFELIEPRAPTANTPSAPLHKLPIAHDNNRHDLVAADMLMNMGDTEGAIQALQSYVGDQTVNDTATATAGRIWARFRLGGLYDKVGRARQASASYDLAQLLAEEAWNQQPTEDTAFVQLFSTILRAEVRFEPNNILAILADVCAGQSEFRYTDDLADDVLDYAVFKHLAAFFPELSEHRPAYDRALATYRVRKLSRQFARDYDAHGRWRLRVDNANHAKGSRAVIYHVLTTERVSSLLALRPATRRVAKRYQDAEWIGIRLDLSALVSSSLSANPTSVPGNIALAVNDPAGGPLLVSSATPQENVIMEFAPVESSLGGLRFLAIPLTDPAKIQNAERNQLILGLVFVLVALGGAFMLIRSINHQTQLAQMKVQLLSRVTHELKTPLAVIKMYGETLGLGRAKDQEQVSKFAGIISTESDRLTNLVERILDFSKMEAGTFHYQKQRVDLGELVDTVKDEYLPHAEARGTNIVGDVKLGLMADVDPEAMTSSVLNLLENAVKYTPEATAGLDLEVELHQQNGNAVLEVRDRGLGIPSDELARVFDDFFRASNAGEVRGAGLGLSLVDHFARSHQGKVEALARQGGGTTMRMTIPLAE